MGTVAWLGTATAVAQESRATPANVEVGDVFTLSLGGVLMASFTATVNTVANVIAGLITNWNPLSHPYGAAVTLSNQTTYLKVLANTAGVPFVLTSSATNGGAANTQTLTVTTPTASAGPNDWSTATNWSTGAIPVNSDDVIIKDNAIPICWGLDQSAVTLNSLTIDKTFTATIGLDRTKFATSATATNAAKPEYRDCYLKISATNVRIGDYSGPGSATGSGRILLNTGSNAATVEVIGTAASPTDTGRPAVRLLMNHASSKLYVRSAPGGVGIAIDAPGETSTLASVSISDSSSTSRVFTGDGTTITTWQQEGGNNVLRAAATVTAVTVNGGTLTTEGDYTITTLTVNGSGAVVNSNHVKTGGNAITTLNATTGTIDGTGSNYARTWATVNMAPGGTIKLDKSAITITTLADYTGRPYSLAMTAA